MAKCCQSTCNLCPEKSLRLDDNECLAFKWGAKNNCDWNSQYCEDEDRGADMRDCCPCECGTDSCLKDHAQATEDDDECIAWKFKEDTTCKEQFRNCEDEDLGPAV